MTVWLAAVIGGLAVAAFGWRLSPASRLAGARPPARRRSGAVGAVGAAIAGSFAVATGLSPAIAVVGLVVAAGVAHRVRASRRNRVVDQRRRAVVELIFAAASELRAGRSPAESIDAAVSGVAVGDERSDPVATELFARICATGRSGQAAVDDLHAVSGVAGFERLGYLAAALDIAGSAGGRVAAVLEHLGGAMDRDEELRQELEAALAGPRASMVMLGALPLLGIGLGQAMGAAPLALLLHRPLGWGLLAAGAGLDLAGIAIVRLITRSALSA